MIGKKRKFWKNILFFSIFTIPFSTQLIVSCSRAPETKLIEFDTKNIVTEEKRISCNFKVNASNVDNQVDIDFATEISLPIEIVSKTITLENNRGSVEFQIDESVDLDVSFLFDLKFNLNVKGQSIEWIEYNFSIYFLHESPVLEDVVYFPKRYCSVSDAHVFDYEITFLNKPKSNITVELVSPEYSDLLTLPITSFPAHEICPFKINIPVNLSMSIFDDSSFFFSLILSFTNSFGIEQKIEFPGCTAQYTKTPSEIVPFDYLNLVPIESSNNKTQYRLTGLKDGVNPVEAGHYRELQIPNDVSEISENAFSDANWFQGVRTLKMPNSVQVLGQNCFSGLINLVEMDITSYEGTPPWYDVSNIFNSEAIQLRSGYVWSNNSEQDLTPFLPTWGLPNTWNAYNSNLVSKPEYFDITNEGQILRGIKPDCLEQVKSCKVIKIPDGVVQVSGEPFNDLKNSPYIYVDQDGIQHKQTRRLILNRSLESLSDGAFRECGFSGPLVILSENITSIATSSFENLNNFGFPEIPYVETETNIFELIHCLKLKEIKDFAFNNVRFEADILDLPQAVTSIGQYAFQSARFKKILLRKEVGHVGNFAFANNYFEPGNPVLDTIDLSSYTEASYWMTSSMGIFDRACVDNGTVIFNNKIKTGIDDFDEWFDKFKTLQSINPAWTATFVD